MKIRKGYMREVLMVTICKQTKLIKPKYQVVIMYSVGSNKDLLNKRVEIERETYLGFEEAQEDYNKIKEQVILEDNYIVTDDINKFETIINKKELDLIKSLKEVAKC